METLKAWAKYLEPGAFYFALAIVFTIMTFVREPLGLPGIDTLADIAKGFFDRYGLIALYISAVIESLFMISFYFPGSLVVILAILVSDRSPESLAVIVIIGWASDKPKTGGFIWQFSGLFLEVWPYGPSFCV